MLAINSTIRYNEPTHKAPCIGHRWVIYGPDYIAPGYQAIVLLNY